jgi:hypothetical protein
MYLYTSTSHHIDCLPALFLISRKHVQLRHIPSPEYRAGGAVNRDAYQISFASTTTKRLEATGFLSRPQPSYQQPSKSLNQPRSHPNTLSPQMSRLTTTSSTTSSTDGSESLIRRSWHAMSDLLSPFSPAALAQLPKKPRRPSRYTRANEIPDVESTEEDGQMPTVRDYHSITTVPAQVRVPKKTPTPVRVEGKVWFANERSMSYFPSFLSVD